MGYVRMKRKETAGKNPMFSDGKRNSFFNDGALGYMSVEPSMFNSPTTLPRMTQFVNPACSAHEENAPNRPK
jgi:hypothetical protein